MSKMVLMPATVPSELIDRPQNGSGFDEELFDLCRADDYAGLYAAFVRRFSHPSPTDPKKGDPAE